MDGNAIAQNCRIQCWVNAIAQLQGAVLGRHAGKALCESSREQSHCRVWAERNAGTPTFRVARSVRQAVGGCVRCRQSARSSKAAPCLPASAVFQLTRHSADVPAQQSRPHLNIEKLRGAAQCKQRAKQSSPAPACRQVATQAVGSPGLARCGQSSFARCRRPGGAMFSGGASLRLPVPFSLCILCHLLRYVAPL